MKKLVLLFLLWSFSTFAQSNNLPICEGDGVRFVTITDQSRRADLIQNTINLYANYPRGDRYELCFIYSNELDQNQRWTRVSLNPLQVPATADKPVIISGLDLRRDPRSTNKTSPLFVSDGAEVILHNSKFTCAANTKPTSIGIKLLGDAHQIIGSEIQNCGTGIQVGDAQTAGNNNRIQETKIHDNSTGIKVTNGQGNLIEKNSIYKNNANNDNVFSQAEGIKLEANANGDIVPPSLINTGGQIANADDSILSYPEGVTDLPEDAQQPVMATFKIQMPFPLGKLEVTLVNPELYPYNNQRPFQGAEFFNEASCSINGAEYVCQLPMTKQAEDKLAVILFHDDTFGTSTYGERIKLNKPLPPASIPISGSPGPIMGGSELTGSNVSGGGGGGGGAEGGGVGAVAVAGGGVEAASGGAAISPKCSLSKNAPAPKHFYLTFIIPMLIFFSWRFKTKEAPCHTQRKTREKFSHE
ncbi:MAG: right-handed parallel beta-helix repeat-containing protein [Deltaproteobacteria bacterium]|nr:right-handed parallel beta-helix repeat-containing protein [Deltaproteobacteria bacterium]